MSYNLPCRSNNTGIQPEIQLVYSEAFIGGGLLELSTHPRIEIKPNEKPIIWYTWMGYVEYDLGGVNKFLGRQMVKLYSLPQKNPYIRPWVYRREK